MTTESDFSFIKNMYGAYFKVTDIDETATSFNIALKTISKKATCPSCGEESKTLHSTYKRNIEDTPFHNKNVHLKVTAYRFYCENVDCKCKVFMEDIKIADKSKVRTHWLNTFILTLACRFSSEGTSRILKEFNIHVSNDAIDRLIDGIEIVDNPDIQEIGVDEIAYRKGQTYCTAIYDLKTHRLIALLEGRTTEVLKEWLRNHQEVKMVTRDRASAYAKAIKESLPNCIQVADKFHLMQNLLNCLKDVLKTEIPEKIFIKDGIILDSEPKRIRVESKNKKIPSNNKYNYDNTPVINQGTGEILNFDNKLNNNKSTHAKKLIAENAKKK